MMRNEEDANQLSRVLAALPERSTASRRLAVMADAIRAARARGVEWAAIVQGLAEAGITRPDGRPLAPSTVAYAIRRLDGKPRTPTAKVQPTQATTVAATEAPALVSAPSKPIPKPRPPRPAGEFSLPPEVEAFLSDAEPGNPACEVDNLLKGLKNG